MMTLWGNNFKNLVSKTLSHGKALVFTLRKTHKVYVFKNIMLRNIFETKKYSQGFRLRSAQQTLPDLYTTCHC